MSSKHRIDAERVDGLDPFHSIVPYVMPKRTEAEVSLTEKFDITELNKYIKARNSSEQGTHLKLFHAICTSIARTIYHRPYMNRFIAGRHYWQRKEIALSFVAKQAFKDNAEETLMFLKIKPEMTINEISHIILGDVARARSSGSNDLDKTMKLLGSLPRFILEIIFFFVRRMEYHGIMPAALMAGDPNYSTALLSNLGSIGAGAPYHHLSDYGTCSIMITIGTMYAADTKMPDGTVQPRDYVDMTLTLDERIADGFYFAKSLRLTKYMLENPLVLEQPIGTPLPAEILS